MSQVKLQEAFELAVAHHRAGRMAEAESLYRQVLDFQPGHIDALQLLAQLSYQVGRHAEAAELLRRAIALDPANAGHHSNLGAILAAQGKADEAIAVLRHALSLKGDSVETRGNLGNALQAKGLMDEAIAEYRRALALKPNSADIHNNLANSFRAKGELDEAIKHFHIAASLRPGYAEALTNLGHALVEKKQWDEAIAAYREVVRLWPDRPESHLNLGKALVEHDHVNGAIGSFRRALSLRPDSPEAHYGLANALKKSGDLDQAIESFRDAVRFKPDHFDAYNNLGVALQEKGELDQAAAALTQAVTLWPQYMQAHNNLGIVYHEAGRLVEAIAQYRRALEIEPRYPEALANLALVLEEMGQVEEALSLYRQALALKPDFALAQNNLANALRDTGRIEEALAGYRRAAQLKGDAFAAGNLLFALHGHPDYGPREIFDEHIQWARKYAHPLRPSVLAHGNDRSPDRRLRIGYVSPDFNEHPVGRFLLPLMANRDKDKFEVVCYSDLRRPDAHTERLARHADEWRKTRGMSDERLAAMVRDDRIDILVDLTMHTKDNRLLVFARKPAPVQVSYLAYCGTTGLDTIDYRLTDPYLDPPDGDISVYTEKSVRLPRTYWCYQAPRQAPAVAPLPARGTGGVTFGCLNSFAKVNSTVIKIWCQILDRVPRSRLLLHSREGTHRAHVQEQFIEQGVDPQRLEFIPRLSGPDYFQQYHRIDIALDPFPYPGGTTTCDALWMGVPVVTLAGQTAVSRGGCSILSNIGLPQLVARTSDQYVQIASDLAGDLDHLADLRATLRPRMQSSPLMDAPQFARDVEAAVRVMWQSWCRSAPG